MTGSFCASRRKFLAAALISPQLLRSWLEQGIDLRVRIADDGSAPDVVAGARMSVEEAARAASLLGSSIAIAASGETVVIVASTSPTQIDDDVVTINAATPADRSSTQGQHVFHLAATQTELDKLWDGAAERFGAGQLNARYLHMYGKPMTAMAWAGWFAVKVAWEAALRTRSIQAEKIAAYLTTGGFDGHKGKPLRFDATTRTLR